MTRKTLIIGVGLVGVAGILTALLARRSLGTMDEVLDFDMFADMHNWVWN